MSSSIFFSTDDLTKPLASLVKTHIQDVRVQSLHLQAKSTGAGEDEICLEIDMELAIDARAKGVLDWVKWSAIQSAINRRHVLCVAIIEVSPRVLHLTIWSTTFVLWALQWLVRLIPKPKNPNLIERSRDCSSVKIHLDKLFLPLPGEPLPVALADLLHIHRVEICPGSPGAVVVEFEICPLHPHKTCPR